MTDLEQTAHAIQDPPRAPDHATSTPASASWLAIIGIGFFAFALRATYIYNAWSSPAMRLPLIDAEAYRARALEILAGDWVGTGVYYLDPLYPFFLAAVYSVVAPDTIGVLLAQALLDSLSVVLIMLIAGRVFDGRVALLAGLIAASYKLFFYYDGLLLKAPLMIFLIVVALYLIVRAADQERPLPWLAAGFALGLAAATRGNTLLFAPALALWILIFAPGDRKKRWLAATLLGLGVFGALLPGGIRNYVVGGDFVLLNSQGGQNFYIGNFRGNDTGGYVAPPFLRPNPKVEEQDFADEARRLIGRDDLKPSEISSYWLRRGFEEIAADPAHFIFHTARKALVFANHYEIPDNSSYAYFERHVSPMLRFPFPSFAGVLPLALAGMLYSWRRPLPQLLMLFFFAYASGLLLFFNLSRMRLPVVPVAIVFAGYAIVQTYDLARVRDYKRMLLPALVAIGMIPIVQLDLVEQPLSIRYFNLATAFERESNAHWHEAQKLRAAGQNELAEQAFKDSLEQRDYAEAELLLGLREYPDYPPLRRQLRNSLLIRVVQFEELGDDARALEASTRLVRRFERFSTGFSHLGLAHERIGNPAAAEAAYRRALRLLPANEKARLGLERVGGR